MTDTWTTVFLDFNDIADSEIRTRVDNGDIIQQACRRCSGSSSPDTVACIVRYQNHWDACSSANEGVIRVERVNSSDAARCGTSSQLSKVKTIGAVTS